MSMVTVSDRLNEALQIRGRSTRSFQQELAERDVPGASTAAVYRYLKGEAEPSLAFIEAAAEILDLRTPWLAFGIGYRDDEEERLAGRARVEQTSAEMDLAPTRQATVRLAERGLPANRRQLWALQRFDTKLDDADFADSVWGADEENRIAILAAALEFLISADTKAPVVLDTSVAPHDENPGFGPGGHLLLPLEMASPSWYAVWSDALLNAFSLRVKGFGEQTGRPTYEPRVLAFRAGTSTVLRSEQQDQVNTTKAAETKEAQPS